MACRPGQSSISFILTCIPQSGSIAGVIRHLTHAQGEAVDDALGQAVTP